MVVFNYVPTRVEGEGGVLPKLVMSNAIIKIYLPYIFLQSKLLADMLMQQEQKRRRQTGVRCEQMQAQFSELPVDVRPFSPDRFE
jgi:hypothetical protein